MNALTAPMKRVLAIIAERGPMTCTEIGESLWGGKRNRQAYARPAGKLIAKMRGLGHLREAEFRDGVVRKSGTPRKFTKA